MNEKCGYYSDGECNICGMGMSGEDTFCRLCKDNPNCYYKQLSEVSAILDCKNGTISTLANTRDKLKAENERLKDEKDKYYQQTLDDEITLNELYQVLQEIKEIAEQCMNKDTCYDCEYCDDCYIEDVEIPTYDICKLLIQKITKAEEE